MKKLSKIIGIVCTIAILFCLAACGSSPVNQGSDVTPDTSEATASQQEQPDNIPNTESTEPTAEQNAPATESTEEANAPATESTEEPNAPTTEPAATEAPEEDDVKVLVAYFSATGTTKKLAEYAADATGADLYEIQPENPYTDEDLDYGDSDSRSSVEMDDPDARPAISGSVENMEQYDIVIIGYPIWWGEAPRIMSTFIESYDFSGKTLVAFCTSGGSGFGRSDSALKSAASEATWLKGDRLSSSSSREDMVEWINGLELGVEAK